MRNYCQRLVTVAVFQRETPVIGNLLKRKISQLTRISNSVWKSALMNRSRLYDINSWVLFNTLRVANIKSFFIWKSWTFSISRLNFFGSSFTNNDAFIKMMDDASVMIWLVDWFRVGSNWQATQNWWTEKKKNKKINGAG